MKQKDVIKLLKDGGNIMDNKIKDREYSNNVVVKNTRSLKALKNAPASRQSNFHVPIKKIKMK